MPLSFIPVEPAALKEGERTERVNIYINKEAQKYFIIFATGNTEEVIQLIKRHKGIVSALQIEAKNSATTRSLSGKRAALVLMDADADKHPKSELEIEEIVISLANLPFQAYDLMEQLLAESLHTE